ncbi:MAG: NADH-quinone oxidoreductase subunit C [Candidatus Micrarchaeia archaeon]
MKRQKFSMLKKITAIDYNSYLEIVYIIYNLESNKEEIVSTKVDLPNPEIESIMKVYSAADWYERELSEMFGIKIKGRETPRLLLEEWNGIDPPLRKSFEWGKDYKKMD